MKRTDIEPQRRALQNPNSRSSQRELAPLFLRYGNDIRADSRPLLHFRTEPQRGSTIQPRVAEGCGALPWETAPKMTRYPERVASRPPPHFAWFLFITTSLLFATSLPLPAQTTL